MAEEKTTEEASDAADELAAPSQPAQPAEPDPLQQLGETAHSAEAELFPSNDAGEPGDRVDDEADEPATFASAEAPWVGAEKKWLNGEEGAPGANAPAPGEPADTAAKAFPMLDMEDDPLLITPQIPVLQSIIPPAATGIGLGFKIGIIGVLIVVVAAAAAIVYWMNERFSAREQEILALRASDKQDVVRLERRIQDLLAQGGAENEARANALQIELMATKGEAVLEDDTEDSDRERRRRQRNDSEGSEEADSTPDGPATGSHRRTTGAIDDNTFQGDDTFRYLKDPVADLLDGAFTKPLPASTQAPAPVQGATDFPLGGTDLPQSPSREQVKAAMDSIAPQVVKCGAGSGRIVVSVAVAGATGRVMSAEPTGDHAGTPLGLCAARAVKLAKFPAFKQDRLRIKYPFDL